MENSPGFELLYEDGPVLAVSKPAGVATQAPPGIDSLEVRIKAFLKQREARLGNVYLAVPHRLDRPVTGAMVFARHTRAAKRLSRQFEARTVGKTYWACFAGEPEADAGTWTDHVRKIPELPRAEIVAADHPDAKLAVLHYRRLGATPFGAWLEVTLETGRMHQVRLQAASRGLPILGDAMYGSTIAFGPGSDDVRQRAISLHARTLSFEHPMTKAPVSITAPLPEYWSPLGVC